MSPAAEPAPSAAPTGGDGTAPPDGPRPLLGPPGSGGVLTYDRLFQAATLPVLGMLVAGLVAGAFLLMVDTDGADFASFVAGPSLLLGNLTATLPSEVVYGFLGAEAFGLVPLAPLVVLAFVLSRTDIGLRARNLRVAVIAGAMTGIVWIIAAILVSIIASGAGSTPRPVAAFGGGLSVWSLVHALVRSAGARRVTLAAGAWSLLVGAALTIATVYRAQQGGVDAGELTLTAVGLLVLYTLLSTNVAVLLGVWPFGVNVIVPTDPPVLPGVGVGQDTSSFYEQAGQNPWLWLAPLAVIALVAWCGWRSTPPTSRRGLQRGALVVFGGLLAALSVAVVVGQLRGSYGQPGTATLTVSGAPFVLIVPVALFTAIWLAALYLRANQQGLTWAALPDLDAEGRSGDDVWNRLSAWGRGILAGPGDATGPTDAAREQTPDARPGPSSEPSAPSPEPPPSEPGRSEPEPSEPAAAATPGPPADDTAGGPAAADERRSRYCTSCGAPVTTRFCGNCGQAQD